MRMNFQQALHPLMRLVLLSLTFSTAACTLSACADASGQSAADVRRVGDAYLEAIAQKNAQAAANLWTEDAEFSDLTTGRQITGKEAILKALTAIVEEDGAVEPDDDPTKVKFISTDVAIEEGLSWTKSAEDTGRPVKFVVMYVKRDGQWRIQRVWQSQTDKATHYRNLHSLKWMIGQWEKQDGNKTIKNVCRWAANRNFITRTFEVLQDGKIVNKGTEVIGWDSSTKCIRSWTFDSTGSFAASIWQQDGEKWSQKIVADMPGGQPDQRRKIMSSLDWMIGDWKGEMEDGTAEISCQWVNDGAFMIQRWNIISTDDPSLNGVTVVGWDPASGNICSWMLDSDGGVADAIWSQDDAKWRAQNSHLLPDGRRGSSVTLYWKSGNDELTWQRTSQELNGEILPDEDPVKVKLVAAKKTDKE